MLKRISTRRLRRRTHKMSQHLRPESLECRRLLAADTVGDIVDVEPIVPAVIQGRKWEDLNGNGQHDVGEPGLARVTIYSDLNRNGVLDRGEPRTQTMKDNPETDFDEAGLYSLRVGAGEHLIREVVPHGFEQTYPRTIDVSTLNDEVTTEKSQDDFASVKPRYLGMRLAAGERNVEEVAVSIDPFCIQPIQVDVVASDPDVEFRNLSGPDLNGCGGDVSKFSVAFRGDGESHRFELQFVDTLSNDVFASIPVFIRAPYSSGAHTVVVGHGESVEGIDFGNQRLETGSIHGTKWLDANGNGQQDRGESGIPGVTIYLDTNFNHKLDDGEQRTRTLADDPETKINEAGHYSFNDVVPGRYSVREVVPDGFVQTFPRPMIFDHAPDSERLAAGGSHHVGVRPGEAVEGIDFGNQPRRPASVHGTKWLDRNANGRREDNEPGLAGVTIYADLNFNGELDRNEPRTRSMEDDPLTRFDETGHYWLEGLRPGFVSIREIVPDGYRQTFPRFAIELPFPIDPRPIIVDALVKEDGTVDADVTESMRVPYWNYGGQHLIYLNSGQVVESIDFGNRPILAKGAIQGRKWLDRNGDGDRDRGEPGLAGVTVYLDLNENNHLDRGEPQTRTQRDDPNTDFDETGLYRFDDLRPGSYAVREVVPDGSMQTYPRLILIDPLPPIGPLPNGASHFVDVRPGEVVDGVDFGNRPVRPGSIHGIKWLDRNGNGERDRGEPGLPGVTIYADRNFNGRLDRGEPATVSMRDNPETDVDETGHYRLEDLRPGYVAVREIVPNGYQQTYPRGYHLPTLHKPNLDVSFSDAQIDARRIADSDLIALGGQHVVFLGSGEQIVGIDFGNRLVEPASVHGTKWLDSNGNGRRDPNEAGLPGVTIYSDRNLNGRLDRGEPATVTMRDDPATDFDEGGRYSLKSLRPGNHLIREVVPDGFVQTFPRPTDILSPWPTNESYFVHLEAGEHLRGLDFGNRPKDVEPGMIGGIKWWDQNRNGRRDRGEPGLSGVTIYLDANRNGELDRGELATTTREDNPDTLVNETGWYAFDELAPGNYVVREIVPDGYAQSFPGHAVIESTTSQNLRPGVALSFELIAARTSRDGVGNIGVDLTFEVVWPNSCGHLLPGQTNVVVGGSQVNVDMYGIQVGEICLEALTRQRHTVHVENVPGREFTVAAVLNESIANGQPFRDSFISESELGIRRDGAHHVELGKGEAKRANFGNFRLPVGDFDHDGDVDNVDIDLLSAAIRDYSDNLEFDLSGDNQLDRRDLSVMVKDVLDTDFGDTNLDGQFDSEDIVDVFVSGKYNDRIPGNAGWADGDWNGDGDFNEADFVLAFTDGGYVGSGQAAAPIAAAIDGAFADDDEVGRKKSNA